jgi:predicted RNase H-like nuclease
MVVGGALGAKVTSETSGILSQWPALSLETFQSTGQIHVTFSCWRLREVHPELCFYELNGRVPMPNGKKSRPGRTDREQLLLQAGFTTVAAAIGQFVGPQVAPDDIIDAYAACWTAERIYNETAGVVPAQPPTDARGLRMEILR